MSDSHTIKLLVAIARAAGSLSTFCDRLEHGESADRPTVREAGAGLREAAFSYAAETGLDLLALYAARLGRSERAHVLAAPGKFDGEQAVRSAVTLRQLQQAQISHDREYRPDVYGLSRYEQLRHCALHVAKLAGTAAELHEDPSAREDFETRRLPDVLLFGLKLATLADQVLPDDALEHSVSPRPNATSVAL